jgi:hypothetical protein
MSRLLICVLLVLLPLSVGCRSLVEAMGYTVVDEEIVAIDKVRDAATARYVDSTLPLLEKGFEGKALKDMEDLGKTLKRVSRKESLLLSGQLTEEEDD